MNYSLTHNETSRPNQNQRLLHLQKDEIDNFIDEKMNELLEEKAEGDQDAEEK